MPSLPVQNPAPRLRRADATDLDAIMAIERGEGFAALVGRSPRGEHEARLGGPRHLYLVNEGDRVEAFAILRDLDDSHGNVYLQRIAVRRPGQGTGAAFLAALIDWTFAGAGAHRIHLDCFEENARAQGLYAKLGFTRDGLLRQAYLAEDGRRRNLVLMALTRPEWLSRCGGAP